MESPADKTSPEPAAMSKSAMKKAAKAQFFAEGKAERRAKEKERRKANKRTLAEKRAAGELDEDEEAHLARQRKRRRLAKETDRDTFPGRIIVDLGFDDKMSDKEVVSLTSQIGYVYAANRRAPKPFANVLFTGLNGRTLDRMKAQNDSGHLRWDKCEWWEEGYEALWRSDTPPSAETEDQPQSAHDDRAETAETSKTSPPKSARARATQSSVVYLTADASEELTELKPDESYIIGGVVDRNRYKCLCLDKAKSQGIRHARLPIGTYLSSLPTRKVLTVNQVFEILLKWVETRDWEQALLAVMPQRKFHNGQNGSDDASGSAENLVVIREEDRNGLHDNTDAVQDEAPSVMSTDPALEKPSVEVIENTTTID